MSALISPQVLAAALGQFSPTDEQSAVISAPMAPALVVAGAGSGKTETMAGRVVWLIANGLVARDQVLGLTFTRKAAGELAERIHRRLQRLGEFEARGLVAQLPELHRQGRLDPFVTLERAGAPSAQRLAVLDALALPLSLEDSVGGDALLHRPTVSTYNSFADSIVRDNAVRIGRDPESVVLSESAAWLLMRSIVLASDDERLVTLDRSVGTVTDAALRIARDSVDNLVDLADLASFGARFDDVLSRPSDTRTAAYRDVLTVVGDVQALGVLADLAAEYNRKKRARGVIDFADQVAGALTATRSHPAVADELRQRYPVVLLDEYQDTSVLQTDLLATLFRGEAVMAVGDPHQSIYGWRGASAGNLGGFAAAFAGGPSLDGQAADSKTYSFSLLTSWRNSKDVLTAANAVLTPLAATSPVPVDELRPRPLAPQGAVGALFEADLDSEADAVAQWCERVAAERKVAGQTTSRAILFRSKKHMVRFAHALAARGIAHRILGLGGLLSTPEVVDVVAALRVISDPHAGSSLIRLLAGPRWAIGLADLDALRALAGQITRHDSAQRKLPSDVAASTRSAEGTSIIDALDFVGHHPDGHAWLRDFTSAARERLREASAVFSGLRRASGMPIPELVRMIESELRLDIELATNETRGPARVATEQLRAFVDELSGFLAADDTGSLSSLLAWLDHAEQRDEFAPRTEPPEPDVVQLLTIHGSKGLEWDAVAVVRAVGDELPSKMRGKNAWLSFGELPYEFRGDAPWLPLLKWTLSQAPTQVTLRDRLVEFHGAVADRHLEEERRLAYVAITRARDHLLLTGSAWAGTKEARRPSIFLEEVSIALGGTGRWDDDPGENPYLSAGRESVWPMDPLGMRRERVTRAADLVTTALHTARPAPHRELHLLLAERAARSAAEKGVAPTRIPASRYKDFATDYDQAVQETARPMPERPFRQTRLGTLFHAWVEARSGLTGASTSADDALWEVDEELTDAARADLRELDQLQATFLQSEWASLQPLEVESEINFGATLFDDGHEHIVICKLDAVYRRDDRGGRIEIVDWKTGRAPRNDKERAERMLQLDLYRRAYHEKHGVPLGDIDVALYYVAENLVLRG